MMKKRDWIIIVVIALIALLFILFFYVNDSKNYSSKAPTIILSGKNEITMILGEDYKEEGATATSSNGDDLTDEIEFSGQVDTSKIGTYTITYTVTDEKGNKTIETRIVTIKDTIVPVITLNGSSEVTITQGNNYIEDGAIATDNYDGDLTNNIIVENNVDTNKIGTYIVTYNVSDSSGNKANEVVRTVYVITKSTSNNTVVKTTPVLVLNGSNEVTIEVGSAYIDAGASATDEADNDLKLVKASDLNVNKIGTYTITYTATNKYGNKSSKVRTIHVVDTTKPVITLLGDSEITINFGDVYTDAGATSNDNYDGDISSSINAVSTVNTNEAGDYIVTYNVSDSTENAAVEVKRIVHVIEPTITVNAPVLQAGMKPIKWDGSEWVETTSNDSGWYNYASPIKRWANAKTADGSMWVWIPRFIYRISDSNWHMSTSGTIDIQFTQGTNDNWNNGVIGDINTDVTATASDGTWTNEPAFTLGSLELKGFWVAKFEASNDESDNIKVIPNVSSWRNITIGDAFSIARTMKTNPIYGWGTIGDTVDTHMMKNTEWGAVVYLSQSIYGKNSEIWINNSSTYTTGCAGNSVSEAGSMGCENTYDTANGKEASTTGNIYGIYDMSGGAWEYMAAYIDNGNSNLTDYGISIVEADIKYKDIYDAASTDSDVNNYDLTINHKGDALYEISSAGVGTSSWFSDYSYMPYVDRPWFLHGGVYYNGANAGAFRFGRFNGSSDIAHGFRVIVTIGTGPERIK